MYEYWNTSICETRTFDHYFKICITIILYQIYATKSKFRINTSKKLIIIIMEFYLIYSMKHVVLSSDSSDVKGNVLKSINTMNIITSARSYSLECNLPTLTNTDQSRKLSLFLTQKMKLKRNRIYLEHLAAKLSAISSIDCGFLQFTYAFLFWYCCDFSSHCDLLSGIKILGRLSVSDVVISLI